jgi:hypothetical protein
MPEPTETLLTQTNTDGQQTDVNPEGDADDETLNHDGNDPDGSSKSDGEPDDKGDKPDGDEPEGAPEKYEDFTMPDGMELDKEMLDDFLPIAKELNLTQEQAQKLADLQIKNVERANAKTEEAFAKVVEGWKDSVKADSEIGGSTMGEKVGLAVKAMNFFGDSKDESGKTVENSALKELLETSQLGNHPEVIRVFYRIGKAFGEDRLVTAEGKSGGRKPFYENSNHVL